MLFRAVSKHNELRGKHRIPAVGLEIMLTLKFYVGMDYYPLLKAKEGSRNQG